MQVQSSQNKNDKHSLYAAYMLRIYITLNIMGFSVSLPVIVNKFDALSWYAIILVAGTTASTIVSAFSGRIVLILGRRKAIMISTIGTMVFSVVCAFAPTLPLFILSYFVMNIFSGLASTMPVAVLIDSSAPGERPRFMSLYSVMNNIGILCGPLLGGLVTDHFGFCYTPICFLPLAVITLIMLMHYYRPPVGKRKEEKSKFDFSGGVFLIGGVASLIVFLNTAGEKLAWNAPLLWGLALMFGACLYLFLRRESHTSNAIIPLSIFKIPSFSVANILIPLIIPQMTLSNNFSLLLIQTGLGQSATSSATYVLPKTLAIMIISLLLGKWISYHRTQQKKFVLISGALIGTVELMMGMTSSMPVFPVLLYGFTFLLGVGESMYYMTLYSLYQRDLSPLQMPTGIAAQFLLASLSSSLASTMYGIILSLYGENILSAYPVMCFATLVPTALFLVIACTCLHSPQNDDDPMLISFSQRRMRGHAETIA